MKKHLAKVFGGVFAVALLLTGCATVSNVKNESKTLIYGGNAVTVGDFTYFANAYTPYESNTDFDYDGKAKVSYLSRIDNKNLDVTLGKDFSPNTVEKVNDKVVGYQNQQMFVLGDYIYFTSMSTHQDNHLNHDYSMISFYRSGLNGDGLTELYYTKYFSEGQYAPVGDLEHGYYWICYTGAYSSGNEESGKIFSIKLDSDGRATEIADKATSAAFSNVNEDGQVDKVFYTTTETSDTRTLYKIYSVGYDGNEKTEYNSNNEQFTMLDKIEDDLIYTNSQDTYNTYFKDVNGIDKNEPFTNGQSIFERTNGLQDLMLVAKDDPHAEGYVYKAAGGSLMYKNMTKQSLAKVLLTSDQFTDILFVDGDRVYVSNDTSILCVAVTDLKTADSAQPQTIVSMTSIQSGEYGFDGEYVYFFGGLEDIQPEDDEEESDETETDDNKYMYRVNKAGGTYQLIGKTISDRTPKQEN